MTSKLILKLFALNFYYMIVELGSALVNYHKIEIDLANDLTSK